MNVSKHTKKNGQTVHNVDVDTLLEQGETQESIDVSLLVDYKKDQRTVVNSIRNSRINAGIEYPADSGNVYDSDDTAKANITGAVVMYGSLAGTEHQSSFVQPWIKADGETEELTGPQLTELGLMLGQHVGKHRVQAASHKKQLEAATETAAVDAVVAAYAAL